MADLKKGYTCQCGERHTYSAYVFAHWDEVLTHRCGACEATYAIYKGVAKLNKRGPNKKLHAKRAKESGNG